MADSAAEKHGTSTKSVMLCMELCRYCVNACVACVRQCSKCANTESAEHQACVKACKDCITACTLCAAACESGNLEEMAACCRDCMTACDACEKACEACKMMCSECANACAYCASCCKDCVVVCADLCGEKAMDAMKSGRMISSKNRELLMQVMGLVKQLVPDDETPEEDKPKGEKSADELLIAYGGAVKALPDGKFGGYAVRFGGKDLTGDDFGKDTNFGFAGETSKKVDILLHHAQPMETKSGRRVQVIEPIGNATLKMSDDGVLIEDAILFNADRYAKHLDRLGWSTGAASHSVIRDESGHIKQWQVAELSLTPIPAEPRNMVAAKSLADIKTDIEDDEVVKAGFITEELLKDFRVIGEVTGKAIAEQIHQLRQNAG